jgi:DNA repair protein RadC
MSNEHAGHRSRLRDRVRKGGLDHFQNYQVLEYALTFVIPYKDTNVIAHKLINKFGSFSGVLEADEDEIAQVDGMGAVSAHFLANLLKIYHYYEQDKVGQKVKIVRPQEAVDYVKQFLNGKLVEELYVVCITPNNKVESIDKISEGTCNETSGNIRKINDKMNRAKVSNIVLAHNHPKGRAIPSPEDDSFTKAVVMNMLINGCHLMDHIIIGENGDYYSYRREGLIDKFKEELASVVSITKIAQPPAKYEVEDD